jgi:tetratricopeptide (TPR) repeat protein
VSNPRIEDLRRRVASDPASIAFAQLAEEYRRERLYDEAIRVCQEGLARYPGYVSARVTLARTLIDLGRFDQASAEISRVFEMAPDNVAAARALDDLRRRQSPPHSTDLPAGQLDASEEAALRQLERWLDAIRAERAARPHIDAAS